MDFTKTLIKPLYKRGDKYDCGNYREIRQVSVRSELLGMMILIKKYCR